MITSRSRRLRCKKQILRSEAKVTVVSRHTHHRRPCIERFLLMQQKQQYVKKERLQRFNQHVDELRADLKQDLAKKVPATWMGREGGGPTWLRTQHVAAQPASAIHKALQLKLAPVMHKMLDDAGCCASHPRTSASTASTCHLCLCGTAGM